MASSIPDFSRVPRSESDAASFYNRLAPWYDFLAASEKKFIKHGLDILDPQPGETILEIGFGTGYAQKILLSSTAVGFCAGVDLALEMGRIALTKLDKLDLADQSGLICSNSLPLPFPNQVFDGIFSSFTLELFDSPLIPKILMNCRRVIKPGGRLVIVSLSKDNPLPIMGRLYEHLHNQFPGVLDCRPIPVINLLQSAGFTIQQYFERTMWGLPVVIAYAKIGKGID
jgi:demethylmenaquinone methyltransferase/2-methoxy-6-polyprenyl-1,4-benzoquinol methylase